MAEEDIIFGKNRHFFGGIEPSNMKMFKYRFDEYDIMGEVELVLPDDTVVDGQTLCTVAGVVVRASHDHYPVDEFDGDLLEDVKASGGSNRIVYDSGGDAGFYKYFAAFPYTTQGVYNRNPINRCSNLDSKGYIYGYDIDLEDPEPSTRVTYPRGVDNHRWTPVSVSDDGTFDAGDWVDTLIPGQYFTPQPCILSTSGTVLEYLDPDDYSKTIHGEESNISNSGRTINAMMEWPKIYTKRWEDVDGVYHFRCSNIKIDDDWECWCNYNENGEEIDHFYTAIYQGVEDSSDRIRSIKGLTSNSNGFASYTTTTSVKSAVEKNGSGWDYEHVSDRFLIQDLLVMLGRSTNCRDVFGVGNRTSWTIGETDTIGLFGYVKSSGGLCLVKVFGMEGYWNAYTATTRALRGISSNKGYISVKPKNGSDYTYSVNTITSFSNTEVHYGYLSKLITTPFGRIPVEAKGSLTTYETDRCDFTLQYSYSGFISLMDSGNSRGPFSLAFVNSTSIYTWLSYKPLIN